LVCVDSGGARAWACVRACVWALPSTVPVSMHYACLCVCVLLDARKREAARIREAEEHWRHTAHTPARLSSARVRVAIGQDADKTQLWSAKFLTREKNNTGAPGATPAGIVTRSAGDVSPAGTAVNRIIVRTAETAHGPGLARSASFRSMRYRSETSRCSRTNQCHRHATSHAPSSFDQAPGSSSSRARAKPALFPGR
jgi:hypothetical protein